MASGSGRSIFRKHGPETTPPLPTWSWTQAVAVFVVALVSGYLVRILLLSAVTSATAQVTRRAVAEVVWLVVVVAWLRVQGTRSMSAFGRPARWWPELRDGAVFGAILYGAVALGIVVPASGLMGLVADRDVSLPAPFPAGLAAIAWILAVAFALLLAPVVEELLFRGLLFAAVRQRSGVAIGIAVSAPAFGLLHYTPRDPRGSVIAVAAGTVMGAGLAILYERRGNLVAPISAHAAFNAVGLLTLLRQ